MLAVFSSGQICEQCERRGRQAGARALAIIVGLFAGIACGLAIASQFSGTGAVAAFILAGLAFFGIGALIGYTVGGGDFEKRP